MVKKAILSEADLQSVKAVVAEVEKTTRGEIVVMVVPRSDSYLHLPLGFGLAGLLLATLCGFTFGGWGLSVLHLLECQLFGLLLGVGLAYCSSVARFVAGRSLGARAERAAMAEFIENGLHRTKEHTGILVYISVFEHKVIILADKGVHEKAGGTLWDKEVAHIIKGIREAKAAQHLEEAIRDMGSHLARFFPRRADDKNELPDDVLT